MEREEFDEAEERDACRLIDEEDLGMLSDEEYNRRVFADPSNPNSSLRAGARIYTCPECEGENRLSAEDVQLGYRCNECADRAERGF